MVPFKLFERSLFIYLFIFLFLSILLLLLLKKKRNKGSWAIESVGKVHSLPAALSRPGGTVARNGKWSTGVHRELRRKNGLYDYLVNSRCSQVRTQVTILPLIPSFFGMTQITKVTLFTCQSDTTFVIVTPLNMIQSLIGSQIAHVPLSLSFSRSDHAFIKVICSPVPCNYCHRETNENELSAFANSFHLGIKNLTENSKFWNHRIISNISISKDR